MMKSDKCNDDVYKNGVSLGLFEMTKVQAEEYCRKETLRTGNNRDWHYIGGRVHVKVLIPVTE